MATREDFFVLAELVGVDLSAESLRFTRSLERSDALYGEHIISGEISGDRIPCHVHLLASNRAVITDGVGSRQTHTVSNERCDTERFYATFRPKGIDCKFVEWTEGSRLNRFCWLLDV